MDFRPVIAYIEDVIRKEKNVPGCDLLIMKEHEILLRYKSGVSDYAGERPVQGNERYFMYSCSKPITCTAALQLAERGIIGLDDPVSRYLPEFADVFLLKDGDKVPASRVMTVRHLFTMSGGLDYDLFKEPVTALLQENPEADTIAVVSAMAKAPLLFEPGTRFEYSLCHDVLAAVVEAASGMKFSAYLNENIFMPLGMTHTGFSPEEAKAELAAQYTCPQTGTVIPMEQDNNYRLSVNYESGGAGIISSIEDYAKFADAMANGGVSANGARILKPETIDMMRADQLTGFLDDPSFSCAAGPGYGYGLGVRTLIDKSQGARSSLGEFGWDGAAGSYLMMDPKTGLSIVFTMHVRNWTTCIGCGHAPIRDLTYEVLGL